MNTVQIAVVAMLIAGSAFAPHTTQAQNLGDITRKDIMKSDLSVPGREVIQVLVGIPQGVVALRHSHPGEEIAYVVEGALEYSLEGKPPVTVKAGEALFIPAGTNHSVKNVGSGHAVELATYIVEKGKPLVTVAQ